MKISDLVPWKKYEANGGSRVPAPFLNLQREMNALFDSFFSDIDNTALWSGSMQAFSPSVDVTEEEDCLVVTAEVPGIEPDEVDVSLTGDALVIKGEKKREFEEKEEDRNFYRIERSYGAFTRTVPLPPGMIEQDGVSAEFKNGVLTVTLPKVAGAPTLTKRIEVKAG